MKTPFPLDSLSKVIKSETKNNGSRFTLKSKRSGKEYTYKLSKSRFQDKMYLHVFVETGYLSFTRLGYYNSGRIINKKQVVDTPSAVAISWLLNKLDQENLENLDSLVEVMHFGKCLKCGSTLTDSNSIEIGLGPVCATK